MGSQDSDPKLKGFREYGNEDRQERAAEHGHDISQIPMERTGHRTSRRGNLKGRKRGMTGWHRQCNVPRW